MNQLTLPAKPGHGEHDWQELPTVKTSVALLPPQPSPPVTVLYRDKYERLKRYMGARITTGFQVQSVLFHADEYARKLVGSETVEQLDLVATLVEVASLELGIHPAGGGGYAPSA